MLLRGVAHVVSYGVGIASESRQYFREKKEAKQAPVRTEEDVCTEQHDDDDWDLDDAIDELDVSRRSSRTLVANEQVDRVDSVISNEAKAHPGAFSKGQHSDKESPLPFPVILPQRSPRHRAYAPFLVEVKGIDQATFMNFLEDFDAATRVDMAWDVINVAAFAGGLALPTAVGFPRCWRTNQFLDKVNERLFMPHGLYCMMITYKPDRREEKVIHVDYSEAANARAVRAEEVAQGKKGKNFQNTQAAKSRGELSIPEAAPLIYPALSNAADAERHGSQPGQHPQFTSYRAYIRDYIDRRRQANFAAKNPTDPFATLPEKPFASSYADPNHQMYHHDPINMVTGGKVDLWKDTRQRRLERSEEEAGRELTEAEKINVMYDRGFTTPAAYVRRVISQDALYMVICNLPKSDEMEKGQDGQ